MGFYKFTTRTLFPRKGTLGSAGFDLFRLISLNICKLILILLFKYFFEFILSPMEILIPSKKSVLIDTEMAITIPQGTYGRIAMRSSLALKFQLDVLGFNILLKVT